MRTRIIIALLCLVFFPVICEATQYTVGYTDAADDATCVDDPQTHPCATIQYLINNATIDPGDTVTIRADSLGGTKTYTENITWNNIDGSLGNGIEINARSGDTITINGTFTISNSDYIELDGNDSLTITGLLTLTSNNVVQVHECTLQNAIDVNTHGQLTIDENTLTFSVNVDAIDIDDCTGFLLIEENLISGAWTRGLELTDCTNINRIRYNRFIGPGTTAIYADQTNDDAAYVVYGNVFSNWTTIVQSNDHECDYVFYNNTIDGDFTTGVSGVNNYTSLIWAANNVFEDDIPATRYIADAGASLVIKADYNLYGGSAASTKWLYDNVAKTFAEWQGLGQDTHSPTPANPQLKSATDFSLKPISPALFVGGLSNSETELHSTADAASDPNGNEADSIGDWVQNTFNTLESQAATKRYGSYALHFTAGDAGDQAYLPITVESGKLYVVGFDIKTTNGGGGSDVLIQLGTAAGDATYWQDGAVSDTTWTHKYYGFVASSNDFVLTLSETGGDGDVDFYIDMLTVSGIDDDLLNPSSVWPNAVVLADVDSYTCGHVPLGAYAFNDAVSMCANDQSLESSVFDSDQLLYIDTTLTGIELHNITMGHNGTNGSLLYLGSDPAKMINCAVAGYTKIANGVDIGGAGTNINNYFSEAEATIEAKSTGTLNAGNMVGEQFGYSTWGFRDAANENYSLTEASALIDAGSDTTEAEYDYYGIALPVGSDPIGAYEMQYTGGLLTIAASNTTVMASVIDSESGVVVNNALTGIEFHNCTIAGTIELYSNVSKYINIAVPGAVILDDGLLFGASATFESNYFGESVIAIESKSTGEVDDDNCTDCQFSFTRWGFDDAASEDYHLAKGSGLRNAGSSNTEATVDFDGVTIPYGMGYEVGAFEYTGGDSLGIGGLSLGLRPYPGFSFPGYGTGVVPVAPR